MLIRHLSYFVTLADERHFARAADRCNISQPTLSAAVRKLEDDLAARLVVRDHRYLGLTEEGEKLLSWGKQILSDYTSLRDDMAGLRRGLTGTLRLGVIPAAMPTISLVTSLFSGAHPSAKIDIRSMTSRAIQRSLDSLEIDGGITYLENEPLENVLRVPLYHERYIFAVHRSHPLANSRNVTWKDAAAQRLCLLGEEMQNRRIIDKLAASVGVAIEPEIRCNSFLAVCSHLRHGEWASIMPHTFLYLLGDSPEIAVLDLVEPAHEQSIGLVLSNRPPLSPMAQALMDSVKGAELQL